MDGSSPMVNSAVQGGGNRKGSFNQTSRGRGMNPLYANRGGRTYFRGGSARGRGKFNNNNKLTCQICHRNNHTADKCFYRADLSYVLGNNNNTYSQVLTAFADADWGSDVDNRRSTMGSITAATCELVWLRSLLNELGIKLNQPSVIWTDNLGVKSLSINPVYHSRTNHLELDLHFVREKVMDKTISVQHAPTIDQIADVFTKPLSGQFFARIRNKLNVTSKTSLELRGHDKGP
ncbi:hypothetical protein DH2020_024688 [Rehmannia glutinosa]|uniref:Uncharacterized protein n=1 Tax=Rehmannia glutinosa TaxID=99300 RepID=A0ABR0W1W6_REHGL